MARNRSADSNIVEFPQSDRIRLEQAIQAFDNGDSSHRLFEEFMLLANKGLREANYFVGCMYEDGSNGIPKNPESALRYYEHSIEGLGYVEGYLAAARLWYHGDGVNQEFDRALRYYEHVARGSGHLVACFMMGRMHQRGQGTSRDLAQARDWYSKAISAGSVYGILNLAMLEAEEGHILTSLWLRIRAGIKAFMIARRDPRDIRLRGG